MIKIEIEKEKAVIFTPFEPNFISKIKGIGGARWNSERKAWVIPVSALEAARAILRECYGQADNDIAVPTCTLILTFNDQVSEWHAPVAYFGKVLSHAYGRDSGAKPGEDVAFIKGKPTSGGSVKNWYSVVPQDAIVELYKVPVPLYEAQKGTIPECVAVEKLEAQATKAELLAEKERLLTDAKRITNRLAEIEEILKR